MNTEQKLTPREHLDGRQMGGQLGLRVKTGRGLRSTDRKSQNRPGDVQSSRGKIVHKIVVSMCGALWVLDLPGRSLSTFYNV